MQVGRGMRFRKTALVLAISVILQATASAQDTRRSGEDRDAEAAGQLDEVVVTGKFQQSLIDRIPIAPKELPYTLNILDRDFLDARNFDRPIEALTTLPNITRTEDRLGTGTAGFLARGFEAPILVDNRVQNNFRGAGARDDAFVERYEILKGPASISLGPIGAGGVINTVTKVPQADAFTHFGVRADQFGSAGGEFDFNPGAKTGSEALLFRVSGAYRDFQFDADETRRETLAIRPVVTLDIGAATSARASVSYVDSTVNPNFGFPLLSNGQVPPQIDTDTFTGFANGKGKLEDRYYEAEINHSFLDNLKLTFRGSKQDTDFDYKNTLGLYNYNYADGGPGIGLNDPYVYSYTGGAETSSSATFFDVQLAYQVELGGRQQDFVIGAAGVDSDFERLFSAFPAVGPFRLDELHIPRFGPSDIGPVAPATVFDQELRSFFAEAAVRPTDWLTVLGGLRHDELKDTSTTFRGPNAFVSTFDDSKVTGRIGATASVSADLNVYVSFAQAFTPQFGVRRNSGAIGPELSDGYELGLKGVAFDGLLSFETGLFHTVRKDVAVRDPNNGVGEFFVVTVGELVAEGFEFTGTFNPTPALSLIGSFGYTDIEITRAGANEVTAAVFPKITGSVYGAYEIQSGALEGLSIGGGFRHVGDRDGPVVEFSSYTVADINLRYPVNERLTVSFDIHNVGDEFCVENAASFAQRLTAGSVLGAPRTAVLTLRWKL